MKNFAIVALLAVTGSANAQVSYTGGTYTQNFDTLGNVSGTTTLAWANNSTIPGWNLFNQTAGGTAITTYLAHDGSVNNGSFYSFGVNGQSDRALGGLASGGAYWGSPATGTLAGWIAVAITNATATPITDFTVGFNGEQWRTGGTTNPPALSAPQSMVLQYGFGATFAAVSTWNTPGGNFDWTSPVFNTSTAAAVDGNTTGLVANRGGTISNQNWAPGQTLWVRWIENNDANNDHGLAIDDFRFSAIPTPGATALLGLAGVAALRRRRA
jgi:hypothetical protein